MTIASPAQPIEFIADVLLVPVRAFSDSRGQFAETFRSEWFPQVSWAKIQTNRSDSVAGVLRGLHYHFHQVDYWMVTRGTLRVGMADLRPGSPTYRHTHTLELSGDTPTGLFIPIGVAHGFYALTDVTLTYIVNNYYGDGSDERGVAWNDPELAVGWNVQADPTLSPRDVQNRRLRDIPAEELPR